MKSLTRIRRPLVVKILIAALSFLLGFIAHAIWIRRQQILDILDHWYLYYQD